MKKIALIFASLAGLAANAHADTYNCRVQEISSWSFKVSNEFLFPSFADYNDSNGRAYVCGHRSTNGCDSGVYAVIRGEHYWKNDRYNNLEVYRCSTGGANAWSQIDMSSLPECKSTSGMKKIDEYSDREIWAPSNRIVGTVMSHYHVTSSKICWKKKTEAKTTTTEAKTTTSGDTCSYSVTGGWFMSFPLKVGEYASNSAKNGFLYLTPDMCVTAGNYSSLDPNGETFRLFCRAAGQKPICELFKCKDGYDKNGEKCVAKAKAAQPAQPAQPSKCSQCKTWGVKAEICTACCAKPAAETYWNPQTGVCQCMNGGEFTKGENGAWSCVVAAATPAPAPAPAENPCTKERMDNLNEWALRCKDNQDIMALIDQMRTACAAQTPLASVVDPLYGEIQSKEPWNCKQEQGGTTTVTIEMQRDASRRNIDGAYNKIRGMMDGFKVSVWRDAEGKFNTSRLVSDSVAGVVLGTAGGLITSSVIKKNQIKGGFEDMSCAIGGQTVAGWGDEFSVGLK